QPVVILSRTDTQTAVTGVNVGAQVIVSGAGFLNEGDRVNVAQAPGGARSAVPAAAAAQPAAK
ncbi:MAG: efflux RND transporter periplasmic adaptor subunit, partial [Phenylobacterium sp.]|nr:efflux RND transporter periplasmic adaptor subunit [Phenylobacterium sp.]